MSKFSERCKKYLEADGHTIYSFAKSTGLDRTSVHRLVTGKRLPSREFLLDFCDGLRINAREAKEILELYEEEKVGTAVYQNRKYILRFLSEIHSVENQDNAEASSSFAGELSPFTETFLDTRTQIYYLLEAAFCSSAEVPCILTNFPADSALYITRYLIRLYLKYQKHVLLKHLITLTPNPAVLQDAGCNLKNITEVLPLALSGFDTYLPYYTYSHIYSSDFSQLPWPYYVMTDDAVLEISSDMKRSILHREPSCVQSYRKELDRIFSEARPLMQIPRTPEDSLKLYMNKSWPSHNVLASLESLPCLTWHVPQHLLLETAENILPSPIFTHLREALLENPLSSPIQPVYCSVKSMIHFLKTGQITGQMTAYLPPLTPRERSETLRNFLDTNGKSQFSARFLKLDLSMSDNLYIELLSEQQLLFCIFHPEKPLRFVLLHEPSIYDAFTDFFNYLGDPVNAYSIEETNELVQNLLKEYLESESQNV